MSFGVMNNLFEFINWLIIFNECLEYMKICSARTMPSGNIIFLWGIDLSHHHAINVYIDYGCLNNKGPGRPELLLHRMGLVGRI